MKRPFIALACLALAACQSAQAPVAIGASDQAHALYRRLTDLVKACWFGGDPAFVTYIYSPEVNADVPRILILPRNEPHGRPVLVIEPKSAIAADVYGPLLTEPAGGRVRADLGRWLKGGSVCS